MIIRRTLLQGLAAFAASMPTYSHSALFAADSAVQPALGSAEYLEACVIVWEGSEDFDRGINPIDFWTLTLGNGKEAALPKGCRKVVIFDADISPTEINQGIAHLCRSVPQYYGFDPLERPHQYALHVEGVTDFHTQLRSILLQRSAEELMPKIAVIDMEATCFRLSTDWAAILPTVRAYYDYVIAISTVDEDEEAGSEYAEFALYWQKRQELIAGYCDAVVQISCPRLSDDEDELVNYITARTCDITTVLLQKKPAEISALPFCGFIPFLDWMARAT